MKKEGLSVDFSGSFGRPLIGEERDLIAGFNDLKALMADF
jgi:hypothetical protein